MLSDRQAWCCAIGTAVSDVVTTLIGVGSLGLVETNPIVATLMVHIGLLPSMVGIKLLSLVLGYGIYRVLDEQYRIGVPIIFAVVWAIVTANNAVLILLL